MSRDLRLYAHPYNDNDILFWLLHQYFLLQ